MGPSKQQSESSVGSESVFGGMASTYCMAEEIEAPTMICETCQKFNEDPKGCNGWYRLRVPGGLENCKTKTLDFKPIQI